MVERILKDVALAHDFRYIALRYFNVAGADGHGSSVKEVVETVRKITGIDFPIEETDRRPGDSPILTANSNHLRALTGWFPRHDDLEFIIQTAWNWEQKLESQ